MKKFFLIMFLSVVMSEYVNAYDQHTHVNITKEAYQLLKIGLGRDIPIMQAHLGDFPIGLGPWQTGLITNGAWRECCFSRIITNLLFYRNRNIFPVLYECCLS